MKVIKTIDLLTEQKIDHYECFNGCFIDGRGENGLPFSRYEIIRNCNCLISCNNKNINISNKHHAIVFYKDNIPVRLMVINKNTDVDKCVRVALDQNFGTGNLRDLYKTNQIESKEIDLKEKPIENQSDFDKEIDVGSCDRWKLLFNMLKGSYTESDTDYGNYQNDRYEFLPNISIKYELKIKNIKFEIEHECAFINAIKTRIIPIQKRANFIKD